MSSSLSDYLTQEFSLAPLDLSNVEPFVESLKSYFTTSDCESRSALNVEKRKHWENSPNEPSCVDECGQYICLGTTCNLPLSCTMACYNVCPDRVWELFASDYECAEEMSCNWNVDCTSIRVMT